MRKVLIFFGLMMLYSFSLQAQTVTGSIIDEATKESLPGTSIVEKGTSNGTITDMDGNFSLTVSSPDAILVVSFVGYITQEVSVSGKTEININLAPDLQSLDEVVVIGYGTVKKSDLTGAVASVSAEDLQQSAVAGVDQALQGRTAGVNVTANSGTPGAAPTVRIRGVGTVTNSDPFFVVDGMPISADAVGTLNPGDIESMEILKDASAAAIYGARAANGVVLITTKSGKKGKSQVTFDAYTGVQSVAKKYELLTAEEYITVRNATRYPWEDSSAVKNTDWQDEIFQSAQISNYQLGFMGGGEKYKYAITGSYFDQEGIIKTSGYKRYTSRINLSADVKPWITIGQNLSIVRSEQNLVPEQNEYTSVVIQALQMDPALPVRDSLGEPSASIRNNTGNPVGAIERNHNVIKQTKVFGNAYIDLHPTEWISFKSTFGIDNTSADQEVYKPVFYESVTLNSPVNELFNGNYRTNIWLWENLVTFKKTFGQHNIQALVGYTAQKETYRMNVGHVKDIPENENLWFISNNTIVENQDWLDVSRQGNEFQGIGTPFGPYDATMTSILTRAIYSWGGLIDVTGSFRRDGSSRFGQNKKYGDFASFAGGFKISELDFMKSVDAINFLKLRVGWGELGNQELGYGYRAFYQQYTGINSGFNYTFGEPGTQVTVPGGAATSYSNRDLQWETTKQTNFGLDINLLQNILSFNIDYYIRITEDMLVTAPTPGVSGIQEPPFVNKGEVNNTGLEINGTIKQTFGDFSYNVNLNCAFTKNEVISLGEEGDFIPSAYFRATNAISRTEAGQPIAYFFGYETDGYWQNEDEINAANIKAQESFPEERNVYYDKSGTSPGDIKFKDVNGDNRITIDDRTNIGNPHPNFSYGVNIDLGYKNFDLKIFGQGVAGSQVFMATKYYLESSDMYWNGLTTMTDYWEKEGDNPSVPRPDRANSNDNLRFSDRYVHSGNYFRIKNLQLGYTLPNSLTETLRIERCRFYVAGQNVASFHKYPGFDPEIGSNGELDYGIDRGMYPISRTWMIGLNLSF